MDYTPRKRVSTSDDEHKIDKKVLRLSTKVPSSLDRNHDSWNTEKAQERVRNDLNLHHSFLEMFVGLFKEDIQKIKDTPAECLSVCDTKIVTLFASMFRESLNGDDFLTGENILHLYIFAF